MFRVQFESAVRCNLIDPGNPISNPFRGSVRVCQARLALALLVLCVFADHPDDSLAGDDLALDANLFDRCTDLHFLLPFLETSFSLLASSFELALLLPAS